MIGCRRIPRLHQGAGLGVVDDANPIVVITPKRGPRTVEHKMSGRCPGPLQDFHREEMIVDSNVISLSLYVNLPTSISENGCQIPRNAGR